MGKNRKLYFVNTIGWSSVGVYIWIDGTTTSYLEWPGESATKESITKNGYSIYSYNMVGKDQYDMIIFNNGTSQTKDLKIDYTKPYYYNGEWYSSLDDICYHTSYGYVDLGLPSGTLWATCNVGADSPEDYGYYFAWGETEPKSSFNWDNYKWMTDGMSSWNGVNKYTFDDGKTSAVWYNKYGEFIGDKKIVLELADDAANANWGGDWRMPTLAEQDELRNECTWTWGQKNNVNGYTVTGPNGNSIFLPAAGCRGNSYFDLAGSFGLYWSSKLDMLVSCISSDAYYLSFSSSDVERNGDYRYYGLSVRPVLSK